MRKYSTWIVATIVFIGISASTIAAEPQSKTMYIQTSTATLRVGPQFNATLISTLRRGVEVTILKKADSWCEVKVGKQQGWVPTLSLSEQRPITAAELNKIETDARKTSRMRANGRSATGGVRGLTDTMRTREGQEKYRSDFQSLKEMEEQKTPDSKIQKFRKDGKLQGE